MDEHRSPLVSHNVCGSHAGEWYLDSRLGTPYLQQVLGHDFDENLARRAITTAAESVVGVDSVTDVVFEHGGSSRELEVPTGNPS